MIWILSLKIKILTVNMMKKLQIINKTQNKNIIKQKKAKIKMILMKNKIVLKRKIPIIKIQMTKMIKIYLWNLMQTILTYKN